MAVKCYVEPPQPSFVDFGSLETMFLTHFQLPICCEMGTDILTSLWQNNSTHISDHIHEWRRKRRLIKSPILDKLLVYWFTKSLLPPIARDVAMGDAVTEEQSISQAQYLDLVYSQFGTFNHYILHSDGTFIHYPLRSGGEIEDYTSDHCLKMFWWQ